MATAPRREPIPVASRAIGIVAIGRDEGERLRRCFDALPVEPSHVVYVDSASTDNSVEHARRRGFEVLELDMSIPFTAARARNAGLRKLRTLWPDLQYVQFIDGDCALAPGWLDAAVRELERNSTLAMVCGRRRELRPQASIYNHVCDMEWNTPVGDVESCGGDALARLDAVLAEGGYDDGVMSGEEPELCARLRVAGWGIRRIDHDMTFHDAAMTRFGQWWKRAIRSGHGFAQVNGIHCSVFAREKRSAMIWGLLLPAVALASASVTNGLGLLLLLAYPVLGGRILLRRRLAGDTFRNSALYATFCVVAKFAEAWGIGKYIWNEIRGRRSRPIEYK